MVDDERQSTKYNIDWMSIRTMRMRVQVLLMNSLIHEVGVAGSGKRR